MSATERGATPEASPDRGAWGRSRRDRSSAGTPEDAVVPVPRDGAARRRPAPECSSGLAWLVRPVTHVPGILHLADGRLRFVSTRGVVVDGSPSSLALTPARTGRGGFRLVVGDERLRLHVVRFPGAVDVPADLLDRESDGPLLTAGEPTAGAVWRRLLAPTRSGPPEPPPSEAPGPTVRARGWRPARARRACAAPAPWC